MAIINRKIDKLIQMGDNTQTQDQEITLVSLRPINKMVNQPVNPIPEEAVVLLDIGVFVVCEYYRPFEWVCQRVIDKHSLSPIIF